MNSKVLFLICFCFVSILLLRSNAPMFSQEQADREASLQAFEKIAEVLRSPRCLNCHPSDDVPRVGDDSHKHLFGVVRGDADHNGPVQKCATCHQKENNTYTKIPGAPHWGLAPIGMGWQGLTDAQLGMILLDQEKNGGRSPEDLVKHMSEDALVKWAWDPGEGRTVPPIPFEEFKQILQTWLSNGAHVPE